MPRSSRIFAPLAAVLVLGLAASHSAADMVIIGGAPVVTYYAPPAVSYYVAPSVSYYATPAVSYYAAPALSYYTPTPVAVSTYRYGLLPRREVVTTYYAAPAPTPVVTYAPSDIIVTRPRVVRYYSPVYLYP